MTRRRITGLVEVALWTIGASALFAVGYAWSSAQTAQLRGAEELRELIQAPPKQPRDMREGSLVGQLDIPRLHLSAVVFDGTSESTLDRGVGHLSTSAQPDADGNIVLAAHRDTFFRPLRGVRRGDAITLITPHRELHYRVRSTEIVEPSDLTVIQPTTNDTLTLITCYPFSFIGAAPQRFIVHADPVQ
jgi:sortase A